VPQAGLGVTAVALSDAIAHATARIAWADDR
jgi:hypothetical protein